MIVVWMPGGPPQMQFWDPKPDLPAECRGTAKPIKTSAPGLEVGHRLPLTAQQGHHFALVRSVTLDAEDDNHILGDQKLLSAVNKTPPNFKPFANRDEIPSMGLDHHLQDAEHHRSPHGDPRAVPRQVHEPGRGGGVGRAGWGARTTRG